MSAAINKTCAIKAVAFSVKYRELQSFPIHSKNQMESHRMNCERNHCTLFIIQIKGIKNQ